MKKRLSVLALALALTLALCSPASAAGDYIAAEHTASNGLPYYLMVNRAQNTVTAYALDENGYYTVPYRAMVCSTGRAGHETPPGTFSLGDKYRWGYMVDGSWGQYSCRIYKGILFHSVCYRKNDPATLMTEEYNLLGDVASLGCVRLQVEDAKWIYDTCARGTLVTVYDGVSPGPLGKPETVVSAISPGMDNGWEPTDPDGANPWRALLADGAPMPFDDLLPGAWYYPALRWVWENGLLAGTGLWQFSPEADVTAAETAEALSALAALEGLGPASPVLSETDDFGYALTRQGLAILLCRYETARRGALPPAGAALDLYADADGIHPAALDAMRWAVGAGLIRGMDDGTLAPAALVSRAQLATVLYRYGGG